MRDDDLCIYCLGKINHWSLQFTSNITNHFYDWTLCDTTTRFNYRFHRCAFRTIREIHRQIQVDFTFDDLRQFSGTSFLSTQLCARVIPFALASFLYRIKGIREPLSCEVQPIKDNIFCAIRVCPGSILSRGNLGEKSGWCRSLRKFISIRQIITRNSAFVDAERKDSDNII